MGNYFLVSSVPMSLYAVTKVLGQIWGPSFARGPRLGGTGDPSSGSDSGSSLPKATAYVHLRKCAQFLDVLSMSY